MKVRDMEDEGDLSLIDLTPAQQRGVRIVSSEAADGTNANDPLQVRCLNLLAGARRDHEHLDTRLVICALTKLSDDRSNDILGRGSRGKHCRITPTEMPHEINDMDPTIWVEEACLTIVPRQVRSTLAELMFRIRNPALSAWRKGPPLTVGVSRFEHVLVKFAVGGLLRPQRTPK